MDKVRKPLPHRMLISPRRRTWIERDVQRFSNVALHHISQLHELFTAKVISEHERAIAAIRIAEHEIGVGEWAVLKSFGNEKSLPLREILRQTGLSRQRIRMLLVDLQRKQFLSVAQSAEGDKRVREVTATPKAAKAVSSISKELKRLGMEVGGETALKSFARASKLSRRLIRTMKLNARRRDDWTDVCGDLSR